MVYLAVTAYEVLLDLVYLLTSILRFNAIETYYTLWVQVNLILFMDKTKDVLRKSWHYLHSLMNDLIKEFCPLIKRIFFLIKAKLLYYLKLVQLQIDIEMLHLYLDLVSLEELLSELQSEVARYKSTLDKVKGLLNELNKFISPIIGNFSSIFSGFYKTVKILICKFNCISSICNKLNGTSSTHGNGCTSRKQIIIRTRDILNHQLKVSFITIDPSKITDFQKGVDSIKKIFEMIEVNDIFDIVVSGGVASIILQLNVLETINLNKLLFLISGIQVKYLKILVSSHVLYCTIKFYQEIQPIIYSLCGCLKFESCNVSQFLGKCSEVEKNGQNVCTKIDDCIKKLGEAANRSKCLGVPKTLLNLYSKIIGRISVLKFYVDLMALEILIFKMIIMNLIWMAISSFLIDRIILYIALITDINSAINTLWECHGYLNTFYIIQLENTLVIFGLSNALKFSQSIHESYKVLLYNLQLINGLIWVIECYVHHLIVFRYVTNSLNLIYPLIFSELNTINQINNVVKDIEKIINKLNSIEKSIEQLNRIQGGTNIKNWKQSAAKIRQETLSVSRQIGEINSEIMGIAIKVRIIYESWLILIYLEYFIFVLILQVLIFIKNTDKPKILGSGLGNDYYYGLIMNIVGPCNKQIIFIFGYLIDMWLNIEYLVKVVETTIVLIIIKMGWLSGLTKVLQDDVDKINKGAVDLECAIEGVVINFIRCTLQSTNNTIYSNISSLGVNQVVSMYSLSNVMNYQVVVNILYQSSIKIHRIFEFIYISLDCDCIDLFEKKNNIKISLSHSMIEKYVFIDEMREEVFITKTVHQIKRLFQWDMTGNHLCLCMATKYILYPSIIEIISIISSELQILSTLSRKYEKYTGPKSLRSSLISLLLIVIDIMDSITNSIRSNYPHGTILYEGGVKIKCFCYYQHPKYHLILNITLYLSSLMENIGNMDPETLRMSIERLSTLYAQLEIYDLNSTTPKPVCCNPVYSLLVNKECQKDPQKCCCCWCSTAVNVLVMCISLCHQFKLFNAICNDKKKTNGCDKVKDFCKVDKCECKCAGKRNGACCLLKTLCSQVSGGNEELKKKLEDCCNSCAGECCCKKLAEKANKGLCKILLVGCSCSCTEASKPEGEVKTWCVFFNDLNGSPRVAVIVYCKCTQTAKECCCLTTLVEKLNTQLSTKLKDLCNGEKCVCEELKALCEKICGQECAPECVCTKLKEEFKKICNGDNGKCGGADKCLCKQIDELKESLKKCIEGTCECKDKEGCCKCPCCKVLRESVRILSKACRQNVLEPYNRIVLDLVSSSETKRRRTRTILVNINRSMVKKISLCKNYNTNVSSIHDDLTDISSVRNWGYDTHHEHQPTVNSNDGYPNINSRDRTGGSDSNKMFKLVLSRLLIAVLVILTFVYLRISYQQFLLDESETNIDSENKFPKSLILHLKNIFTVI